MVIGKKVTAIGFSAFRNCKSLTSIVIPERVTYIGWHAFQNCTSLTSIKIPDSVANIGDSAFDYCTSLASITVGENNQAYMSIDGSLYTKNGKELVQYATGKRDKAFTIPDSVTTIGKGAFTFCTSLTIYCEASIKLKGWHEKWNYSKCPVVWGSEIKTKVKHLND